MKRPPEVTAPPLWQLLRWIAQPLNYLDDCSRTYGECFVSNLGGYRNFVIFSQPEAIAQIFALGPDQAMTGVAGRILGPLLGENSVILLDGDRHRQQRQLLMPPFHGERMKAYGDLIQQITLQVCQGWVAGQSLTMRPIMQDISLRVMLQAVFGLLEGTRYEQIQHRLSQMLDRSTSRFNFALAFFPMLGRDYGAWSPGGRFVRAKQAIDDLLYAEIRERRSQSTEGRSDILSLLLSARDEAGNVMSDEELRDELMTLLIAGHETTATTLSWALYRLHQTPAVLKKLRDELATLDQPIDPGAIARLPYLNAVCCETLRLDPVVFIAGPRILQVPAKILDYEFQPDTLLVPSIYLTHRRPDIYPDPEQFKPERFLERQYSPFEFLPFGGSHRRCIGAAFALYEMKLVLATVLINYELELAETKPVVPVRRGVTAAPQSGVRMVVKGSRALVVPAMSAAIDG
jgi:unspecific monooxygenase